MQSTETVLSVLRERGRRGLPLERLYRQPFNPQLYLVAYRKLYSNSGAMTPGVTGETVDGMSLVKIGQIIDTVRCERWRWSPVRRIFIPKKNGKRRPLGLPTWSDKLLAEVVRMLLNAYYDVQFSEHSHGFRPGRGCHTALQEIVDVWNGTHWFIEGDIARCFESLDHQVMLETLGEKIHDNRFLRLVGGMLSAGYLDDWKWGATLSGAPQGGVASPILSNIYLDRLDKYVETQLLPMFNRGKRRVENPAYERASAAIRRARRQGDRTAVRTLRLHRRTLPSKDPHDPDYRRLRYVRYADDVLFGFSGPKAEAREITHLLGRFLRDKLKLELSEDKTLITHARTGKARFLGYDIVAQHSDDKLTHDKRSINSKIGLRVPEEAITLLIPFTKPDNPTAQAAGVIAFYLLATVLLTSWARAVLPWRWWRRMHLLPVPLWALSTVHTALAGTDLTDPVMYWGGVTVTGMVGAQVAFRLITRRRTGAGAVPGARRRPAAVVRAAQTQTNPSWCVADPTAAPSTHAGMRLVITQVTLEADNTLSLRLTAADGAVLPSWEPGAHIELVLPSGRRRQYSLCDDSHDTRTYRIAVLQVPTGRGGSIELHSIARAGQLITVNGPRNHFPLVARPAYVFIAGGIGITGLMAMAAWVASQGCLWRLV
jgi:group II intron reverse transcriptase/maturase